MDTYQSTHSLNYLTVKNTCKKCVGIDLVDEINFES